MKMSFSPCRILRCPVKYTIFFLFSHISTRILFFYHFKQSATSIGVMHRMGVAHSYLAPILHKMQISHFSAKAQ